MSPQNFLLVAVVLVAVVTVPRAVAEEGIPSKVRSALQPQMERHGDQMTFLMVAVIFLKFQIVERVAGDLVREPKTWPVPDDLPPEFHKLREQLSSRAQGVRAAAAARDGQRLAKAFGGMTATCMGCHALYLDATETVRNEMEQELGTVKYPAAAGY